jgi:hypothetical protein
MVFVTPRRKPGLLLIIDSYRPARFIADLFLRQEGKFGET